MTVSAANTGEITLVWNDVDAYEASISHNSGASSDFLALVLVGPWDTTTTAEYNSQTLTRQTSQDNGGSGFVQIFDVATPSDGSNNLVIRASSERTFNYAIHNLIGIDTVTPRGTPYTTGGYFTSVGNTFATVSGDVIIDALVVSDVPITTMGAAPQTIGINAGTGLAGNLAYSSANEAVGASTTSSWSISESSLAAYAALHYNSAAAAANPILTDTLLDAEASNAPLINEAGLSVYVYDVIGGTLLYSTTTATTNGSGVFTIDDDLVGAVNDTVFVVIKMSAGRQVCGTMTVTDGNA